MAKAKRKADYNGIFAVRLRECLEEQGVSQSELAAYIGKSRQAVNFYTLGETVPDADALTLISKLFNVSADYLLGLSNAQITATDDEQLKIVCDYTGLNEKSVKSLKSMQGNGLDHVNTIFYSMLENHIFYNEAWRIAEYRKYHSLSMEYLRKALKPFKAIEESGGDFSKLPDDENFNIGIDYFMQHKDFEAKATAALFIAQNLIYTKGVAFLPETDSPEKEYEYRNTNIYRALNSAYQEMIDEKLTATDDN